MGGGLCQLCGFNGGSGAHTALAQIDLTGEGGLAQRKLRLGGGKLILCQNQGAIRVALFGLGIQKVIGHAIQRITGLGGIHLQQHLALPHASAILKIFGKLHNRASGSRAQLKRGAALYLAKGDKLRDLRPGLCSLHIDGKHPLPRRGAGRIIGKAGGDGAGDQMPCVEQKRRCQRQKEKPRQTLPQKSHMLRLRAWPALHDAPVWKRFQGVVPVIRASRDFPSHFFVSFWVVAQKLRSCWPVPAICAAGVHPDGA